MPKQKQLPVKSVITYEVPPHDVNSAIINGVLQGFAAMKNAIIVDANTLPPVINRQTFCLLTGISPSKYRSLIENGIIKCQTRDTGQKIAYDVSREEFIQYYQQNKSIKQYELFR